jgi:WD40 repeat protein
VQVHEIGEHEGRPFFSLELVEGGSLAQVLSGTPQPPRQAAALLETLARAVQAAHDHGIVHRDLKPANILLSASRELRASVQPALARSLRIHDCVPKITDFGLAKQVDGEAGPTVSGAVMGTPSYMAPEQAAGYTRETSPAADIYSLGAILYEVLTGRPPFKGASLLETLEQVRTQEPVPPHRLQPRLPRDLETICLKCLQKEPRKRYASALALAADLRRFLEGRPIQARPVSDTERLRRWCRRNPTVAALVAGVALSLVAGTGIATYFAVQADGERRHALTARDDTDREAKRARQERLMSERRLYGARMNLAQAAWEEGTVLRTKQFLAQLSPSPGEEDFRGWEWRHQWWLCHSELRTLESPFGVRTVALSPNGRYVASGGDRRVTIWDVVTGQELRCLKVSGQTEIAVAFSPDGRQLATGGAPDGTLRLWDVATGKRLESLAGHTGSVSGLTFSRDGRWLASASADRTVRLWDVSRGREIHTCMGHTAEVESVAFSPDGRRLASGSADKTVKIWDAVSGQELQTLEGHTAIVYSVAFQPEGRQLASGSLDQTLLLWDLTTGHPVHTFRGHRHTVLGAAFSPDGRWLASASQDETVKIWDAVEHRELRTLKGHTGPVASVAFHPDGHRLVTAGDRWVKVWDTAGGHNPRILRAARGSGELVSVAFSRDGQRLAAARAGGLVTVWNARTSQEEASFPAHSPEVWSVAWSPKGNWLATAGGLYDKHIGRWAGGEVKVWDWTTGKLRQTLRGHRDVVFSVAFSADGRQLASASRDGTVMVWDWAGGQELATLRGHAGPVHAVAFSPNGWLASASDDRTVKIWDPASGREVRTLTGHGHWVYCLAFSPDGRRLASADHHGIVKIWDAATGQNLATLGGPGPSHVWSVALSPDGKRLATAGWGAAVVQVGTVKLWDMVSFQELYTLKVDGLHQHPSVAFSPDGCWLASGRGNGTVLLWDGRPPTAEVMVEREARGLVEFLLARPLSKAAIRARIQEDQTISTAVRRCALTLLEEYREDLGEK